MASRKAISTNYRFQDLAGKRFGKLRVVRFARRRPSNPGPLILWLCRCDCGREIEASARDLNSGNTRSCGCTRRKHGQWNTPEWRIWEGIRRRCCDPNCQGYRRYGAMGIAICKRWRDSFASFYADMGPMPSPKHQIDRLDNAKGYSPENCRWVTPSEQQHNRTNNRWITFRGRTMVFFDWAKELGMSQQTLRHRLLVAGWSVEDALTIPVACYNKRVKRPYS